MTEETILSCPTCGNPSLQSKSIMYSVPYFNEIAMFSFSCSHCNFTYNDVFSAEERPPMRWTLIVDDESLLRTRVVRSSSGTIRLPEFGIDVEPGPAADSFISNVEGVLYRIRNVVEMAIRFADKEHEKERGAEILEQLVQSIKGDFTFTMIIEDPMGTSGILPEDLTLVKQEELSPDEASQLRGAPAWLDSARGEYQERKG